MVSECHSEHSEESFPVLGHEYHNFPRTFQYHFEWCENLKVLNGSRQIIGTMVEHFPKEPSNGLGVGPHFDEIMVSINWKNANVSFVHIQFVIGDDESIGFQKRSKPHDDALGPDLDIAGIEVVVQNKQIVNIDAGLGDVQFRGTDTTHGETLPQGKGFTNGFIDFFGNVFVGVGNVQKHA